MMHQSSKQACEETASYIGRIQSILVQSSPTVDSSRVSPQGPGGRGGYIVLYPITQERHWARSSVIESTIERVDGWTGRSKYVYEYGLG
jgi:hypothetical protein